MPGCALQRAHAHAHALRARDLTTLLKNKKIEYMLINCEFSNPVDLDGSNSDDFEYQILTCSTTDTTTTIPVEISDGDTFFHVYPSFSYAEIVIIFFLITFLAIKIFQGIWGFVHLLITRQKWL